MLLALNVYVVNGLYQAANLTNISYGQTGQVDPYVGYYVSDGGTYNPNYKYPFVGIARIGNADRRITWYVNFTLNTMSNPITVTNINQNTTTTTNGRSILYHILTYTNTTSQPSPIYVFFRVTKTAWNSSTSVVTSGVLLNGTVISNEHRNINNSVEYYGKNMWCGVFLLSKTSGTYTPATDNTQIINFLRTYLRDAPLDF